VELEELCTLLATDSLQQDTRNTYLYEVKTTAKRQAGRLKKGSAAEMTPELQ
jgi:hypothetical protein